jgi:hypothetical protein
MRTSIIGLLFLLPASSLSYNDAAAATSSSHCSCCPLKVFLMVGQSNMQGHGYVSSVVGNCSDTDTGEQQQQANATLEWLVSNDATEYGRLKNKQGLWVERNDVWIAYNRQNIGNVRPEINQHGPLLPGYGGDPGQMDHMGPELGFGWTVGDATAVGLFASTTNTNNSRCSCGCGNTTQQILLLKIAWGGRSLAVDFRPPSSSGKDDGSGTTTTTGLYYQTMLANTFKTLSNLKSLFPSYSGSYELAGFVWHQGWNDGCDVNMTAEYEYNLANLIRDIRTDLSVPNLPVVIGVSGMSGYTDPPNARRDGIIEAQFAVANATKYPEFAGTIAAVETRPFARLPPPHSPGKQDYHWMNNCESYWLVGKAMGQAMIGLLLPPPPVIPKKMEPAAEKE